jgi:3-methylcrotonyl-CoA carboxylase alpha subunit
MKTISKLLIANRGEIARRVIATARRMGIATVAVFSDADRGAPHVRDADEAVWIGPPPSRESYLSIDRLLEAARRTGADAVHPGYGFLSENAAFAEACAEAGLTFIGPPPSAIRAMGLKREAKQTARQANVPVIPGYDGAEQGEGRLAEEAQRVGFPLLIKASAGGGGKGMRVVRSSSELSGAIAAARREAEASFGDGTLLIERYVDRPRHVEIQILGDQQGTVVHLFERECSIQRRHQKIIEESPSTALDPALRERMGAAAVAIAQAIGYHNAGTVEFIVDPEGRFYFLEVNTRLQVEHPVTEAVTGLDLVREQIRIARGEPLGYSQANLQQAGAAIECRLYAEDPGQDFLPSSGRLVDLAFPSQEGLRVDAGYESGSEVSIHYDPLIAKLITRGTTRAEAIQRMVRALAETSAQGIRTNRRFLIELLRHPAFAEGAIDTHFIERHFPDPAARVEQASAEVLFDAAVGAVVAGILERRQRATVLPALLPGYRNNRFALERVELEAEDGQRIALEYRAKSEQRIEVVHQDRRTEVGIAAWSPPYLVFEEDGHRRRVRVVQAGDRWFVHARQVNVALTELPRFPERAPKEHAGALTAPMPGKVVLVQVAPGQVVRRGATLLVLEAMKMEHPVAAPADGVVAEIRVAAGDQVEGDQILAVLSDPPAT